jgi:LDH2 family malate/lactate/ureidoglycolate dehydrogenase
MIRGIRARGARRAPNARQEAWNGAIVDTQVRRADDVPIQSVIDWATETLRLAGLSEADARVTVTSLAFADARGVHTHGFMRLSTYVRRVRAGGINGKGTPRIVADLGALAIVDADHVVGARAGIFGSDLAIERGLRHGIGCAILRNANHFGVAGYYGHRIADAGLLGIVACNTDRVMCPPFGGRPVLGTNPLAVTVPLPYEIRPQLDMATTEISQGRLIMAARDHETIPLGWAVDCDGLPTTSASAGLEGALLPAGGPKGFGLAFAIDALVAIAGAQVSADVSALYGDPSQPQRLGQLFIAVRADGGISLNEYQQRILGLVDEIHKSGPASGEPAPKAPGELELVRERQNHGRLVLNAALIESFAEVASTTGLSLPDDVRRAQ